MAEEHKQDDEFLPEAREILGCFGGDTPTEAWAGILNGFYSEPERTYHNRDHVLQMLLDLENNREYFEAKQIALRNSRMD